jgi:tetratricopeptide (TPR) repeat protein
MAPILHPPTKRALWVALAWAATQLLWAADGPAWGEEEKPAAAVLANPETRNALQSPVLGEGLIAYTSGDYAKALDCFQRVAPDLKGDAAQELQVKIALCHLLLNQTEQGRALLETLRAESAGGLGSLQAGQILQRLDAAQPAGTTEREAVLRTEYFLSMGAAEEARKEYASLMDSGANDATREFARAQVTVLEAANQIMHRQFAEVPALVRKNCAEFRSPSNTWSTVLTIADTWNSRISGDNVDDVFSHIDGVERFLQEWSTRAFPDASTASQYYYSLSKLGLHRLLYAVLPGSAIDSQPLIEATQAHLERALELARKSSLPLQGAIMADLVDVYLMAGQYKEAARLAQALYDEFPACPLVPNVWLKIGLVQKNLANTERSLEWLSKVLLYFPGTYAAQRAQALLGDQLLDHALLAEKAATEKTPDSPAGDAPAPAQNSPAGKEGRDDSSGSTASEVTGKGRKDTSGSASAEAAGPADGHEVAGSASPQAEGPSAGAEHSHPVKGAARGGYQATWTAWMLLTAALLMCLAAACYRRCVRVKPLKGGDGID